MRGRAKLATLNKCEALPGAWREIGNCGAGFAARKYLPHGLRKRVSIRLKWVVINESYDSSGSDER